MEWHPASLFYCFDWDLPHDSSCNRHLHDQRGYLTFYPLLHPFELVWAGPCQLCPSLERTGASPVLHLSLTEAANELLSESMSLLQSTVYQHKKSAKDFSVCQFLHHQ